MARKKTATKLASTFPPPTPQAVTRPVANADASSSWLSAKSIRETVESLVVAFILAFLFRSFEAEAFVIPTGSMAPTLMGQHKDLHCPECGFEYRAGASSEEEQLAEQLGRGRTSQKVVSACCPLCRYTANVDPNTATGREHPTYGGDRILVSKQAYEYGSPKRWDVIVFKYPGEAQTNFIKRMVGLPNETLRLFHGDVEVKPADGQNFALERRDSAKLRAMAQIVYDNDYPAEIMNKAGWPERWQAWPASSKPEATAWQADAGERSFHVTADDKETAWLRYQHFVPSIDQWKFLKDGALPTAPIKPSLITDYYAYNTSIERNQPAEQARLLGMHWVGDLLVECDIEAENGQGTLHFDLVKGGRHFRCQIDGQSGEARLSIDGLESYHPMAKTAVIGPGSHHLAFANIDRQLLLWVDDELVTFDQRTDYEPLGNEIPRSTADDPLDLAPVGIGSQGLALRVSHLKLWRDLYYIATSDSGTLPSDYTGTSRQIFTMDYEQLFAFWSSPEQWDPPGGNSPFNERREAIFSLGPDQFFMLGDNSPMSHDARLWEGEKYVSRELLIGKALLIFWPHSFDRIPGTGIPFPFFPNFARMGLIR